MATHDEYSSQSLRGSGDYERTDRRDHAEIAPGKRTLTGGLISRKANDAGGVSPGSRDLLSAAAGSSGAPLPDALRGRLERSLRSDLSAVRVHTGADSAAAAQSVGAVAYATGQQVHFGANQYNPGSQQGQALIAHEVAHTVQQRGASTDMRQHKLEVSSPSDAHEVEAESFAQSFVSGGDHAHAMTPVSAGSVARAIISRQAPNTQTSISNSPNVSPKPPVDANGQATTVHADPTIHDATNAPATSAPGQENRPANVQVVATTSAPLSMSADSCPRPELIYKESQQQSSPPEAGYTTVSSFNGTVNAPQVEQVMTPSLFIHGQASPDDVQQGGIGDCYFMATLMSITQRDPGKIPSMMTPDGRGGATVTFWRRQMSNPNWLRKMFGATPQPQYSQVSIHVSEQLQYWLQTPLGSGARIANGHGGYFLKGAMLHAADHANGSKWWSNITGTSLEVHRRDEYDTALWAPLMEKAYAAFTEQYGHYGGSQNEAPPTGSGYNEINGGWSHQAMFVFYGAQADTMGGNSGDVQQQSTQWAPGSQILAQNPRAVDQLLLLQTRGSQPQPGEKQAPVITATSMVYALIPRLQAAIPVAQSDPDWANVAATDQTNIGRVLNAITTYVALPADPPNTTNGPQATARQNIGTACSNAITITGGAVPSLLAATRSNPIKSMVELVLDLKNIGTDHSPGQRNIYGDHVYSVMAVSFVSTNGTTVPLASVPSAMRPPFFPLVDTTVSQVTLRNPHHTNTPDPTGSGTGPDGPTQGNASSGIFHMTLEQFFRNFTSVESGVFPKT